MHSTGQTAWQDASVQCIQAMDTERSPGLPSLIVTTRRRLRPHGTSFSFLHVGHRIVSVGRYRVGALTEHKGIGALRVFAALIDPLEPAGEMIRHPCHALADAFGDESLHARLRRGFRSPHPNLGAVFDPP